MTSRIDAIYMLNISGLPGDSKVFNPGLFEEHTYEQVPGYTGDFITVIKNIYIQFCNYIDRNELNDLKDLTLSEFFNKDKEDLVNWYRDNIANKIKEFNPNATFITNKQDTNENPIIEIVVEIRRYRVEIYLHTFNRYNMPIDILIFNHEIEENEVLKNTQFELSSLEVKNHKQQLDNIIDDHLINKTINNINETIINKALVGTGLTVSINKTLLP